MPNPDNGHQPEEHALQDLLLVVFIHGFKGDDNTFGQFPIRLQHILQETVSDCTVEAVIFPAYETRGELNEAVIRFADWLTTITVQKEVTHGGAGKANVVLCGHSMGGLLAADTILEFVKSRPDPHAPLWPKIIACIAFDTPYFGLHPYVFKNSATKAAQYAETAKTIGSAMLGSFADFGAGKATSSESNKAPAGLLMGPAQTQSAWNKWAPAAYAVGGALFAGAAAGSAYYKRAELGVGYSWATDHLKYVGNLWNEDSLKRRVESLIEVDEKEGVLFRTFYTFLPAVPLVHNLDRTFIIIPKGDPKIRFRFLRAENNTAPDEVQAHTGMFAANSNDGYYNLGLETARLIRDALIARRGTTSIPDSQKSLPPDPTSPFVQENKEMTEEVVHNKQEKESSS
ncbi:catalytic protein [Moniliophthora roreri MCA 2997]|uniref:Catalytic protein n=1 Tax=Moniliophthora roreri (strain MCA 2997) TaxID=1381753 RepID=V2X5L5_MONRO|nr:catalytic protein [Moniliophthora roreri MCA 2997]